MRKEDCRVGMKVIFGRGKGQKTLGEVTKCNLKKAKVKTLENRGSKSEAGSEWGVPYSLMEPAEVEKVDVVIDYGGSTDTHDNIPDAERSLADAANNGVVPDSVTVNGNIKGVRYTAKIN